VLWRAAESCPDLLGELLTSWWELVMPAADSCWEGLQEQLRELLTLAAESYRHSERGSPWYSGIRATSTEIATSTPGSITIRRLHFIFL
jgi:hypothetical protein